MEAIAVTRKSVDLGQAQGVFDELGLNPEHKVSLPNKTIDACACKAGLEPKSVWAKLAQAGAIKFSNTVSYRSKKK